MIGHINFQTWRFDSVDKEGIIQFNLRVNYLNTFNAVQ